MQNICYRNAVSSSEGQSPATVDHSLSLNMQCLSHTVVSRKAFTVY